MRRSHQTPGFEIHGLWDQRMKRWHLYAIDGTGQVRWSRPAESSVAVTPQMLEGLVRALVGELEQQLPLL